MKLVIAPNYKQFKLFERQERAKAFDANDELPEFRYVSRPELLQGYRCELIIVNADQLTDQAFLAYASWHNDKGCPVRWVEL